MHSIGSSARALVSRRKARRAAIISYASRESPRGGPLRNDRLWVVPNLPPDRLCPNLKLETLYWYLSATIGSTLVARRAGTYVASSATSASSNVVPPNVSGSRELT